MEPHPPCVAYHTYYCNRSHPPTHAPYLLSQTENLFFLSFVHHIPHIARHYTTYIPLLHSPQSCVSSDLGWRKSICQKPSCLLLLLQCVWQVLVTACPLYRGSCILPCLLRHVDPGKGESTSTRVITLIMCGAGMQYLFSLCCCWPFTYITWCVVWLHNTYCTIQMEFAGLLWESLMTTYAARKSAVSVCISLESTYGQKLDFVMLVSVSYCHGNISLL